MLVTDLFKLYAYKSIEMHVCDADWLESVITGR